MSAHRRLLPGRTKLRRTLTAVALSVTAGLGGIVAAGPAQAAGPWFVAPLGLNTNSCTSAATPCATVTGVLAKGGFVSGDIINVANGTYLDRPLFQTKTADVRGAGSGTVFNGSATSWGIGVAIGNANTLRLSNLRITNGKTAAGAGLPIASGQVIATDVEISGNNATTNASSVGGGAYVAAGASLTMTRGSISSNTATNGGGGAYVVAGGTLTLTDVTVDNNSAPVAGGLYVLGTTTANTSTVRNNSAQFGAGIASAGPVALNGSVVRNNTASSQGGGFFNNTGTLTSQGTTFQANTAVLGGGIYQQAGTTNVDGSSVLTGNSATSNGGGIYQAAGTTNVKASSVLSNSAAGQGGGVYSAAGNVNLTNSSALTSNTAGTVGGGAVFIGGTNTIANSTVEGNAAPNGGAVYSGGATTFDGATVRGNTANGGTLTNAGNAGAIYNAAALTVKDSTFNANKAVLNTNATPGFTGYGGAIFSVALAAAANPTITITNTTINGGDVGGNPVSGGNANAGGAIAALGNIGAGGAATVLNATGLTLSKNVAAAAGGIFSTGPVTLTNSAVKDNKATHASAGIGGGIYATPQAGSSPTLTLDNTDVTGNDGVAGGGGIVTTIPAVVRNGSSVNGNTGAIGAGIYTASPVTVSDSQVNGNSAANTGGGIYAAAAVTMTDSSLDGNSAAFLGGGFSTTATAGGLSMTGGTMSGNSAFGAGGAFVSNSLLASFDDTDLIGNTSTGANFGGGAILSAGQVTINHAQISGNKADGTSGNGGAIFSGTDDPNVTTSLRITNSTLSHNEAFSGAAILAGSDKATSTNKTSIRSSTIHGNKSSGPFGALQFSNPASIVGSTITDNTAVATGGFDAYGGIVALSANLVSLSGSVLAGNNGHQCNVAVADGGYNLNNPTASECSFSAAKNDVFTAPQLGALANNGGPTTTRLPSATSPALDRIPASTATGVNDAISGNPITLCTGDDQRGTNRPQGAKCDIGSVEAEQTVPVLSGPSSATYAVGVAGAPQVFSATGSPQPTLSATGLPTGITFTDNGNGTGTLAGTPGAGTGGVHSITVKATNEAGTDAKTFTLTINQAPALAGPAAATYTVGQAGGPTTFTSTGHPTSLLSSLGLLPSGVSFTDNGDGSGAYAGTPGAGTGGVYPLTVKAANGTAPDATKPFTLTVNEAAGITGPATATFKVGTSSQSGEFVGTGFPVPTLSTVGLPNGLSLTSTGAGKARISGTAANGAGGLYPGIVVTASNGVAANASTTVDLTVNEAPELTGPAEVRFVTGTAGTFGFSSDGFPVAALTRTGSLPAGITFTDNGNGSATLAGTAPASAIGQYTITVTAANGQSPDATRTVTIEVVPPLSISTTSLPNAAYRTAYSAQVTATGGQPGYTFEVVGGSLPAGLSMNQFGLITGSATAAAGTHTFTVKATDSLDPAQTATKQLSITLVKGNTQMDVTAIVSGVQPNGDLSINVGLVEADIKGGFPLQPVAGVSVKFTSGGKTVCTGVSDAKGHAQCSQNLLDALLTPLKGSLTATFAGNTVWNGSTATAGAFQPGSSGSGGGGTNLLAALLGLG